jgi:hypothetical protein
MRRPLGVKWVLFVFSGNKVFSPRRVAIVAMLPFALSRSDSFRSMHWVFSFQPVLPSAWRPVVLLLQSGTWVRPLTQSPELGFGLCLFSSWNRANRASVCASSRSSFLRLSPISRTLRAFATITSCLNWLSKRLIQGECVPMSSAIRLRGIAQDFAQRFRIRADASITWERTTRPSGDRSSHPIWLRQL